MESSIQVGVNGPTVWVRVEGKGSFLNSGSLKEFAREMLDRGYREFVMDLADCAMMDSTFMGTMASVALRLKELGRGHLHVIHCGNRSRELLSGLGLDQIFDIHADGTAAAPECQALERASDGSRQERKQQQTQTTRKQFIPNPFPVRACLGASYHERHERNEQSGSTIQLSGIHDKRQFSSKS